MRPASTSLLDDTTVVGDIVTEPVPVDVYSAVRMVANAQLGELEVP
jgi:hypothetical protein